MAYDTYMISKTDSKIQAVLRYQNSKAQHSVPKEAEVYTTEAGTVGLITSDLPKTATKPFHGKLSNYLQEVHVDVEMSNR